MKRFILVAIILFLLCKIDSPACTIIMVSDSNVVLAGSNEDSVFPLTILWFIPAANSNYERSNEYTNFIKEGPVKMIERGYNQNINIALMFFNVLKTNYPKAFNETIKTNGSVVFCNVHTTSYYYLHLKTGRTTG